MSIRRCRKCHDYFDKQEFISRYVYGRPVVERECRRCRAKADAVAAMDVYRKKRDAFREIEEEYKRREARHRASEERAAALAQAKEDAARAAANDR